MESNELKFLLRLLDCRDYRSPLSATAFRNFKGKDKICQDLGKDGLVDFSREINAVKITQPGSALLKIAAQVPISAKELKVLDKIGKAFGKISKSKITVSSVKASERDAILQSFCDRGLVEFETKLKRTKAEVWLTQKGQECLELVNNYFQFLRKSPSVQLLPPFATDQSANSPGMPTDQEILQTIQDLDQQLGTENYLPIFYLRQKLQPLSREQLDQRLYHLQRNDQIELSSLQEVTAYTCEQIDAGIPQDLGGPLFFIVVN